MTYTFWIEVDRVTGTTANMDKDLLGDLKRTVSMLIFDAEAKGNTELATRLHYAYTHAISYKGEEFYEPNATAIRLMMTNDGTMTRQEAEKRAPKNVFYIIRARFDEARAVEYRMRFHG